MRHNFLESIITRRPHSRKDKVEANINLNNISIYMPRFFKDYKKENTRTNYGLASSYGLRNF